MTETRTIEVKAYRCTDGEPVCALDFKARKVCQFMRTRHFGTVETCGMTGTDIERDDHGNGWLRPVDGCPVWGEK
jgi:hypothetical protein